MLKSEMIIMKWNPKNKKLLGRRIPVTHQHHD